MRTILRASKDPVLRGLFALSIPMTIANIVQQSYLIADSVIVGRYVGVAGLAAVGAGQPVYYLVNSVFLGLLNGFTIRIAHLTGNRDTRSRNTLVLSMAVFVLSWSLLCGALMMFGSPLILSAVGIVGTTATDGLTYLRTLGIGLLSVFGLGALTALFRGLGRPQSIMYVLGASSLLNIALAWLFVGACGMGVRGAALGTVCASTIAFAAGLGLAMRHYRVHTYRSRLPSCLRQLAGTLRLGLPMGAQFVFLSVGNLVLISFVATFGPVAIAAMSIAGRLETVASRVFLDLSGAVTVLVAQRLGAKDIITIRRAVQLSLYCCCCMTIIVVAVTIVLRFPIGAVFTSSVPVTGIVARYILITYPFFGLYTMMAVAHGFLNGIGRTFVPLLCTILSFIVARVPAAALLSRTIGLDGMIWAVNIGWFIGLVFTLAAVRYYLGSKLLCGTTGISNGVDASGRQLAPAAVGCQPHARSPAQRRTGQTGSTRLSVVAGL